MKNYIFCGLLVALFFIISCTRSAVEKNGASVVIQIPNANQMQVKKADSFFGALLKKSDFQTVTPSLRTSTTTTGLDGTRPVNCFGVMVSGPTDALRKNRCYKQSASVVPVSFEIGVLSQIVGLGETIELSELDSGPDRVFRLVGLYAKDLVDGKCPDVRAKNNGYGEGYILSEIGGVTLEAGTTLTLPMPMTFVADKFVNHCEGPDFPNDSGGDSSSGGAKKLAIRKDYFPVNQFMENSCQSVDVVARSENGRYSSVLSPVSFQLLLNGSVTSIFTSLEKCTAADSPAVVAMAAGSSRMQIWFVSPYRGGSPTVSLDLSFSSNPDGLASVPLTNVELRSSEERSFDIISPNRVLPEQCYEFSIEAKYMNNQIYSSHYYATDVAAENAVVYSDVNCTTAATNVNFMTGKSNPIYFKTSAAEGSTIKLSASFSGFIKGEKVIEVGGGGTTLANIEVQYYNQTMLGDCVNTRVTFMNDQHTAINLPASVTLNLSNSGTVAKYTDDQWCQTSNSGVHMAAAGKSSTNFYFQPLVYGNQLVQISLAGVPTFDMNYFAK